MNVMKHQLKKLFKHRSEYYFAMFFRRVSRKKFKKFLLALGLERGMVVFVHCSLSRLGYFSGGANDIISVLKEVVGDTGTIIMPAFSGSGSMEALLENEYVFDVMNSQSDSGFLTEKFRQYPGVVRSLHPSHSVCALGKLADQIVSEHELSTSPCDVKSPFAKLSKYDAKVLRLGTGSLTLYHHVQELVEYPNLFLPGNFDFSCIDKEGEKINVMSKVYRKQIANIFFIGDDKDGQKLNVHPSNFPLLYGGNREQFLQQDAQRQHILKQLLAIRLVFEGKGWLSRKKLNSCHCELFSAKEYIKYSVKHASALIELNRDKYELNNLRRLLANGEYPEK